MVADPCLNPGYTMTKNYTTVYNSPCVSGQKPQRLPTSFNHTGTGNFQECQKIVKKIFNFTHCPYRQCSFNGVFQPPLQGQFGVK